MVDLLCLALLDALVELDLEPLDLAFVDFEPLGFASLLVAVDLPLRDDLEVFS